MSENILKLTDDEVEFIKTSLRRSVQRGEEEKRVAENAGNAEAAAFYSQLSAKASALLLAIGSQTDKSEDDEDTCPECGEDYGFCQCECDQD